jgi:Lrp/AsnC family transcriptional regulator for asnA, asnC and gidA
MNEMLDPTDRDICAALLRNGRASWRLIAHVTGLQERTVSRRAMRLLEQGLVRVTAFAHPLIRGRGDPALVRLSCSPERLVEVARWLAHRPETLWVTTLMTQSAVLAECFIRPEDRSALVEGELSRLPISNFSLSPIHHYRRTVRGWQPGILDDAQLAALGEDELSALIASEQSPPNELDAVGLEILDLLGEDGRMSIGTIASRLGIAKPTVRKRIQSMQGSDQVSIRAVLDPALLGFPYEASVTARVPFDRLNDLTDLLAADPHTRWAAETATDYSGRALMAFRDQRDMDATLASLSAQLAGPGIDFSVEPLLTMYKRSDVILPPAA